MATAGFYEAQDLEALADLPNYQKWILQHFAPHLRGRVLEVGAGIGTLSRLYLDLVDEAVLLEPAQNLVPLLRERFRGVAKVSVEPSLLEAACARAGTPLRAGTFDAVVLINVLEHVPDDAAMLEQLRALLKPGGRLLLFVPAMQWLFGSLDAMLGHRRRYSLPQLKRLIDGVGFEILDIRYFDALGVLPWFITGRILRQTRFNAAAAQLYDRTGVRLGRLAEALAPPPVGKNVLSIAVAPPR
jgi:SAM-dependent methyltransferase